MIQLRLFCIHQRVTPLCNVTFTDHLYFWSERLNESRKSEPLILPHPGMVHDTISTLFEVANLICFPRN